MFLTHSDELHHLDKLQIKLLQKLCQLSNNMYNLALYNARQHYFTKHQMLSYKENLALCKTNENYALLPCNVPEEIIKIVARSFRSFYALLAKERAGIFHETVNIPKYHKQDSYFLLVLHASNLRIINGKIYISIGALLQRQYPEVHILVHIPKRILGKDIYEVRILPQDNGHCFKIQYCYREDFKTAKTDRDCKMGIDLGIDNLATCVTTTGDCFIMDGRRIKSINHYWNKRKAKLQTIAMRQGLYHTHQIFLLTRKRNNQVMDIIRKTAKYIVDYCIENNIGMIVCGYNKNIKQRMKLGKRINQEFTQINLELLRKSLKTACIKNGIAYIEQEEAYSSKASFLDRDPMPRLNSLEACGIKFSGKRIYRGLYQSSQGKLCNADVNAAANILRKNRWKINYIALDRAVLKTPRRITVE